MPRINSYPTITPASGDLAILADVSGTGNPTKTATTGDVANLATTVTLTSLQVVSQDSIVPSTASSAGTTGQMTIDSDYIYICISTNTWKRAAISTW